MEVVGILIRNSSNETRNSHLHETLQDKGTRRRDSDGGGYERQCESRQERVDTLRISETRRLLLPTTHHAQADMKWIATLAVAAAVVGLSSAVDICPAPFVNYDPDSVVPKCLLFLTTYGTWYTMLSTCEIVNGSLAMVNGDLHNIVYKHIIDTPALTDRCFWIGGTDEAMEGTWRWEYDGSKIPMSGPHWDPCSQEPNGGTRENYLAICPKKYYYSDYPGSSQHHAVCQYFY
ncbi:uncharacterized protein LOC135107615 [Scylla paramamosain]|uniref:uncharacterized protein LOC135107615 n=1 Tax=Scylla paramamosain TaxID=85552 RepID=UPI0030836CEB